jgi:acylpyruvate hydrolase
MHFKIPDMLAFVSDYVTLNPGDLILTGTPSGIGPVKFGDKLKANLIQNEKEVLQMNYSVENAELSPKF